ncbi:ABC-three component system protein [Chitinimonas koreensis]|uniref:ABC-three component system protein n=1 Tax=Chitinimonas koreensis TaxID=356302 RepID=UPI00040BA05D|nr:ABC-three component system protein [Chitinimonas koreensis]QNM95109.1 hypothetical protein H9L41_14600 [Chitinimonas koreensis]
MSEENYPGSAISSWSGFVYQGKVALYHSLTLMNEGDLDFELQLDSTDDFAIYKRNKLVSTHQVKAKVGNYRSIYEKALEKSGEISGDRIQGTQRYFHISVEIDDTSDFTATSKETVKFYEYGKKKYCGLGEIEQLIINKIKEFCNKKNKDSIVSENNVKLNYCLMSEKINSKAIEIHKKNQVEGVPENEAAYKCRISSTEIINDLLNHNPYTDVEYFAVELRKELYDHLEMMLDDALPSMTDVQYQRARDLFDYIQKLESDDLKRLCQIVKPSENFSKIQQMDIERYSELINTLCVEPIFSELPHYKDDQKIFYLPTAISINNDKEGQRCAEHIRHQLSNNETLVKILFEYSNLIACHAAKSFSIDSGITVNVDPEKIAKEDNRENRITKALNISVLTKNDAERKLNAQ